MEIEKDVPIPPTQRGECEMQGNRGGRPTTELTRLVRQMKSGDSLLCDSPGHLSMARKTIYTLGGRAVSRKVSGGWRVWRID